MNFRKWIRMVLPVSAVAAGILLLPGTAYAETDAAPAVEIVADLAVSDGDVQTLVGTSTATGTTQMQSGWVSTNGGKRYCLADGSYAVGRQEIGGMYYLFDQNGYLQTGWQTISGKRYYYNEETGAALVGTQEIDGTSYLFDYTGAQKTGWQTIQGVRRYYDPDSGKLSTGWITTGGYRYYVSADTGKQTGEITLQGKRYLLDSTYGYQHLGFCTFSDKTVSYYKSDGSIVSGWLKTDGNTYYFDSSYRMQTGWQKLSGKTYYFASDGAMQTGLQTIGNQTYYFSSAGVMQTGWHKIDGEKYYFSTDGTMRTGWQTISGEKYYFGTDGVMCTGWQTIDDSKYYFGLSGVMRTGKQTIGGKKYTFDTSGKLHTVRICLDAGHYGKYNQSPVNGTYYESDMSWKLHLYLKEALESYGIEVITTRENQATDLGLETRGETAEGCDLFLSLHSNACDSSSVDAPLACCCVDGTMDTLGQLLADTVHEVMGTSQGGTIWKRVGVSGDYYGVLRGASHVGVSGILLEHSYHTNLAATNWLLVDSNLERMAKAEAAVIAAYFGLT